MRVIRTEKYFEPFEVFGQAELGRVTSLNFATAWCGTGNHEIFLSDLVSGETRPVSVLGDEVSVRRFLASAASGFPETWNLQAGPGDDGNFVAKQFSDHIAQLVWETEIVIENSPPIAIPFETLFRRATGAVIGTFIGIETAGDLPLLLFITIPGGIIAAGGALGISKGLEKGLAKKISDLINNRRKRK